MIIESLALPRASLRSNLPSKMLDIVCEKHILVRSALGATPSVFLNIRYVPAEWLKWS